MRYSTIFELEAKHITDALAATRFVFEPYPHIYLPSFFSEPFYQLLLAKMPPVQHFAAFLDEHGKPFGKYHLPLDARGTEEPILRALPPDLRAFWTGFRDIVLRDALSNALVDKFAPFLCLRFGRDLNNLPLFFDQRLSLDTTGSKGYVHTDNPDFVLAFLVYLPNDDSLEKYGTGLFVPDDPTYRDIGNGPPVDCDEPTFHKARAVPFRPNTMVGFFKTARSFHGVDTITGDHVMRRTLIVQPRVDGRYFVEKFGAEVYQRVFVDRVDGAFPPVMASLERCEKAQELGLITSNGGAVRLAV